MAGFQTAQLQQIFRQTVHFVGLAADHGKCVSVFFTGHIAIHFQFTLGQDHGNWCPQFMGGVLGKLALPLERLLESCQHPVKGLPKGADLIAGIRNGNADA